MKHFYTLPLYLLCAASVALANGEGMTIREQAQGTAGVDNEYTEEFKTLDSAPERKSQTSRTREKMEQNPRNPAMVESFEEVQSDKVEKVKEKQERREGEAQGQDYDNPRVWR